MIQLSVCIPTYNRAKYLKSALESIFAQKAACSDEVEVIVCDNASADDTQATVAAFAKEHHNLQYFKNPSNIGFDGNMLKVFSLARGKYCIALGDDDIMLEGALGYLLENIKTDQDFYLTSFNIFYGGYDKTEKFTYLKNVRDGEVFDMSLKQDILRYLSCVRFNAGLFGYIGGFAVKRELWQKVPADEDIMGLGWVHIYNMWYLKNFGCKFKFLERPVINMRMQNDEIIKNRGWVSRLLVEYKGLYILSVKLFEEGSALQKAFLSVVKNYLPLYGIPPYFILSKEQKKTFDELYYYFLKYPYSQKDKDALICPFRVNPLYFVRAVLHRPVLSGIKRKLRDLRDRL